VPNTPVYTEADKNKIKDLLLEFGLAKRDDGGEWVIPRQNQPPADQRDPERVKPATSG
jgi:hypothetical protein